MTNKSMNDYDSVLKAVREDGMKLRLAPDELKNNREIVLAAIKQNPMSLQFADRELRSDYEIAFEAVKRTKRAIQHVDYTLVYNKNFILDIINRYTNAEDGSLIKYLPRELRTDRDIVLAAVEKNVKEYEYAVWSFPYDIGIALTAVKKDFTALRWVNKRTRENRDFLNALDQINPEFRNYIRCLEEVEAANKKLDNFWWEILLKERNKRSDSSN